MNAPGAGLARFPTGRVAIAAMLVGVAVTLGLRIDPYLNADSHSFEAIARSLLAGTGFVYREPMYPQLPLYAFRAPGYSAFLALGLLCGGVTGAMALQGAINGLTAALVGAIAGRLAGNRAAWIAFAIRLAWPVAWRYAGQMLSETFFEFCCVLAVWLAIESVERERLSLAAATGAVLSIAVLTRPVAAGCALAVALWLLARRPRHVVALALVAFVVWLPWPIRNAIRLHAFVPLLTMGGTTFWIANSGLTVFQGWTYMAQHASLGEVGLDHHLSRLAFAIIRANPAAFLNRELHSLVCYLGPLRDPGLGPWLNRFALLAALPALAWADWRRRIALPLLVWGVQGAMTVIIVVYDRYRFPTEWCVVVGAAVGLEAAAQRWGGRRTVAVAAVAMVACVAYTFAISRH